MGVVHDDTGLLFEEGVDRFDVPRACVGPGLQVGRSGPEGRSHGGSPAGQLLEQGDEVPQQLLESVQVFAPVDQEGARPEAGEGTDRGPVHERRVVRQPVGEQVGVHLEPGDVPNAAHDERQREQVVLVVGFPRHDPP